MINTGNLRRENTQAYLIPLLQQAGFNVVPDNGSAEEVFQQRLPALDYDMAMYISTVAPDPQYLTTSFTCAQIPSEENNFQGQNSTGWCNEEASAALEEADVTVDEAARAELINTALDLMADDWAMLPLVQYPRSGIWQTEKVAGPIDQDLGNYQAFQNIHEWEDVDGDGQHRHRRRAVARVPQPGHRVRQLVLVRVDDGVQGPARSCGTRPRIRSSSPRTW